MKKTPLLGGLAALALVAAGGVAAAQQTTDRPTARSMHADADGDGRLSQAEFVARRIERLRAADADGDGAVTADERQASRQARRARRAAARFDRLDADKDGAITRAEFDAAREARAGQGPRGMRGSHGRRAGRHGARAAAPVVIAEVEARSAQAFARLDADRDGYVTRDERRSARAALRGHARRHMTPQASPPAPGSE